MTFIDVRKRSRIFKKYNGVCSECGVKLQNRDSSNLRTYGTIDHIMPKSRGGTNHDCNLRLLCRKCNMRRGNDYISLEGNVRQQISVDKYFRNKVRRRRIRKKTMARHKRINDRMGYARKYMYVSRLDNDNQVVNIPKRVNLSDRQRYVKKVTNRRIRHMKPKYADYYSDDYNDGYIGKSNDYRRVFDYKCYIC